MSTDLNAVAMPPIERAAQKTSSNAARRRIQERVFFGFMALLMIATILLGFRATYFPLGERPTALSSWVIVVHGIVFSLWLALFFVQTTLISIRRVRWHMSLGLAIYGLAVLVFPLGIIAAGPPWLFGYEPRTFSLVSVMGMVMFGTLIAASYALRRNAAAHKRLALYSIICMMDAGIDRWPWDAWHIDHAWSPWVYTAYLLLPVAFDLLSIRRIHWATLCAAPFAFTLHRLEIPIGETPAWHAVSDLMLKLWH